MFSSLFSSSLLHLNEVGDIIYEGEDNVAYDDLEDGELAGPVLILLVF